MGKSMKFFFSILVFKYKQTDSNQRGGGLQGKERVGLSQGTCIKDTWTKTTGVVGLNGGGGGG